MGTITAGMDEQSLADELGIDREDLKSFRKQELEPGDHFMFGGPRGRTLIYTEAGVDAACIRFTSMQQDYVDGDNVEAVEPEPDKPINSTERMAKGLRLCKNPKWIYAQLDGEKIGVFVGKNARKFVGKPIKISVQVIGDETIYKHQP